MNCTAFAPVWVQQPPAFLSSISPCQTWLTGGCELTSALYPPSLPSFSMGPINTSRPPCRDAASSEAGRRGAALVEEGETGGDRNRGNREKQSSFGLVLNIHKYPLCLFVFCSTKISRLLLFQTLTQSDTDIFHFHNPVSTSAQIRLHFCKRSLLLTNCPHDLGKFKNVTSEY